MKVRTVFVSLGAAAALVVATGCASASGSEADAEPTSTAPTRSSTLDPVLDRLADRYAHYDVVAYEGDGMKTLIISYGFTDLAVEDGALTATESFCHSEHRSDQPIETTMDDAATRAIKPDTTEVEVSTSDGRARLLRPETPTGIGIRLADPANDPLPTDPKDPRIADDDGDGKPGVTVHIKVSDALEGELYIARREIFAYDVLEQDDGSLTGTVADRSEQLVVGASDPIFLTDAQWRQVPDPAKSPIILKPVGSDWDCDRLMAARDELFPPTPTVDW